MSTRYDDEQTKKKAKARIIEIDSEIIKTERKLRDLLKEDRTSFAQGLIDRIFTEFKASGNWTKKSREMAEKNYYVFSPIGRKRNLFASMTGDRKIIGQQVRRGSNAPIQGWASEIGVKAGRRIMTTYYEELPKLCELLDIEYDEWELKILYNRMVHDASYYSVQYALVIPFIHILQYEATYGITKAYKDEFNVTFTVEPEIEIEIGVRDDCTHKWDWSIPQLVASVLATVDEALEFDLTDYKKDEILKLVFKPWASKKCRHYLQSKYPLLNVSDLDRQIVEAIRPIYRK